MKHLLVAGLVVMSSAAFAQTSTGDVTPNTGGVSNPSTPSSNATVGKPAATNPSNPQDTSGKSNPQDLSKPGANNPQDLERK